MPKNIEMTNRQKVAIGVTILDEDNQPIDVLPSGASIAFVSSDEAVASVTAHEDGLNATVGSGKNGTATITVTPTGLSKRDGSPLGPDTISVRVVASSPGSINLTVGTPEDE